MEGDGDNVVWWGLCVRVSELVRVLVCVCVCVCTVRDSCMEASLEEMSLGLLYSTSSLSLTTSVI